MIPQPQPHPSVSLWLGDALEVLAILPDDCVDAVCTDPPYELGFMGKGWDRSGIAYNVELWKHCLRVLKPGGHLLAFGGTRTYHRLTCAIEDAGFEIRDEIAWLYGSGFPKSLDVSKAIDKAAATDDAARWSGWGTALKPAHEPIVVARKPLSGTVAANVLAHGTGALNIDACRVETPDGRPAYSYPNGPGGKSMHYTSDERGARPNASQGDPAGRWPSNVVLDEHAAAALDRQSGTTRDGVAVQRNGGGQCIFNQGDGMTRADVGFGGEGGASRFFPTFRYQAKAPTKERPKVDGVAHPTVKPLALMRWLVKLVTPPNGLVLEPFAGSGTTVEACVAEGFRCIAIEREATYLPLIVQRFADRS